MSNEWKEEVDSHVRAIERLTRRFRRGQDIRIIRYAIRELKKLQSKTSFNNVLAQALQIAPFWEHPNEVMRCDRNCLDFIVHTRAILWDGGVLHLLTDMTKADVSYVLGYIPKKQLESLNDYHYHNAADIIAMVPPHLQAPLEEALNIVKRSFNG